VSAKAEVARHNPKAKTKTALKVTKAAGFAAILYDLEPPSQAGANHRLKRMFMRLLEHGNGTVGKRRLRNDG
jgi:hypothetical protein